MNKSASLLASAGFSLALAVTVIAAAGYYERPSLLPAQLLLIAVPSLLPLALLSMAKHHRLVWIACVALIAGSWSYVVYVDTRPYTGGGASLACVIGWMGCAMALVFAAIASLWPRKSGGGSRRGNHHYS